MYIKPVRYTPSMFILCDSDCFTVKNLFHFQNEVFKKLNLYLMEYEFMYFEPHEIPETVCGIIVWNQLQFFIKSLLINIKNMTENHKGDQYFLQQRIQSNYQGGYKRF